LGDGNPRADACAKALTLSAALDLGMNLAPVQVEHAHGDGAGRPVYVGDKRDRADSVSRVREQFTDDASRTVEKVDAKMHGQSRAWRDSLRQP
jgi:hypothetical protein